jgi:hypothetical protein
MHDPEIRPVAPLRSRRSSLRAIALGSAAVFLTVSAYQASFAGSRLGQPLVHIDQYGGGGGGGGEDGGGGLSGGEAAGIGVAAVAVGFGAFYLTRHKKHEDEESPPKSVSAGEKDAEVLAALPEGVNEFSGVRLTPGKSELSAGRTRIFDLQVRSKADSKWYSVTGRAETKIGLKGDDRAVVPVDGVKNMFCVPVTVPRSAAGKNVVVVGTFAPKGQAPLSAEAQLLIRVQTEAPLQTSSAF